MKLRHRAPRCVHGFYRPLCVLVGCPHAEKPEGRTDETRELRATQRVEVRKLLRAEPTLSTYAVTVRVGCSRSLVIAVRTEVRRELRK